MKKLSLRETHCKEAKQKGERKRIGQDQTAGQSLWPDLASGEDEGDVAISK